MVGVMLYWAVETGSPVRQLAAEMGVSERWVEERVEAARLCLTYQAAVQWQPSE